MKAYSFVALWFAFVFTIAGRANGQAPVMRVYSAPDKTERVGAGIRAKKTVDWLTTSIGPDGTVQGQTPEPVVQYLREPATVSNLTSVLEEFQRSKTKGTTSAKVLQDAADFVHDFVSSTFASSSSELTGIVRLWLIPKEGAGTPVGIANVSFSIIAAPVGAIGQIPACTVEPVPNHAGTLEVRILGRSIKCTDRVMLVDSTGIGFNERPASAGDLPTPAQAMPSAKESAVVQGQTSAQPKTEPPLPEGLASKVQGCFQACKDGNIAAEDGDYVYLIKCTDNQPALYKKLEKATVDIEKLRKHGMNIDPGVDGLTFGNGQYLTRVSNWNLTGGFVVEDWEKFLLKTELKP